MFRYKNNFLIILVLIVCGLFLITKEDNLNFKNIRDISIYLAARVVNLEDIFLFQKKWYRSFVKQYEGSSLANQKTIMLVGDSHVAKMGTVSTLFQGNCFNAGIPGDTTLGLLRRVRGQQLVGVKKVVIIVGYNDLKYRSVSNTMKYLRILISRIEVAQVAIVSVMPIDKQRMWMGSRIIKLNSAIKAYCVERNVEFINVYNELFNNGGLCSQCTDDGLHLNHLGYKILSEKLQSHLTLL